MKIEINYKQGGGFRVEAESEEEIEVLLNTALRVLWGKSADKMSLEDTAKWLGWEG